jgi:hypothetical protein
MLTLKGAAKLGINELRVKDISSLDRTDVVRILIVNIWIFRLRMPIGGILVVCNQLIFTCDSRGSGIVVADVPLQWLQLESPLNLLL